MKNSLLPLRLDQSRVCCDAADCLDRAIAGVRRAVLFEDDWLAVGAADGVVLSDPFIALSVVSREHDL